MKRSIVAVIVCICVFNIAQADDVIRHNISWTLEGKNDPIVQFTNQGETDRTIRIRLLIGTSSYRYPSDLDVPTGEHRFLRIQDVIERIADRYPELKNQATGILQVEYDGVEGEIKTELVNLNPKSGIIAGRGSEIRSPVINNVEPPAGSPAGGTIVTITGANFDDSTSVKFGGINAMRNRQGSDTIIAIAPPHSAGAVDIEVSNGKRTAKAAKGFRYELDAPMVTKVDPESGPATGGTKILIQGKNFQPGAIVRWNGRPVVARFQTSEAISLVTPAGKSGAVGLEVVNPDGKNFALPDGFTYRGLIQITSITPRTGVSGGGYSVTISGSNFEQGASVMFGNQYGQTTFVNPSTLAAIVPAGDSGAVDVTVSTPEGETDTLAGGFTYNEPPHITSITATPNPIVRNATAEIEVQAVDPEVTALRFEYRVMQGPQGCYVDGNSDHAIFHSSNTAGVSVIQVFVYDVQGAKAEAVIQITVE
jgi:hypothetical protein